MSDLSVRIAEDNQIPDRDAEEIQMATTYPYISSSGPIVKTIERLRKQFPQEVTAETLRKLGIAPKNESYVINTIRFLGLVDDAGKKVEDKAKVLVQADEAKFTEQFAEVVKDAYAPLFALYGDDAWNQSRDDLVTFFRESDGSSDLVGKRQTLVFAALAALSGHGELAPQRAASTATKKPAVKAAKPAAPAAASKVKLNVPEPQPSKVGLTVRIEVNLPANGDQKTYDAIFQSIRKNLIDSE